MCVEVGTVLAVADGTDIFILLLHFCHPGSVSFSVLMVSPVQGRAVLDKAEALNVFRSGEFNFLAAPTHSLRMHTVGRSPIIIISLYIYAICPFSHSSHNKL